MLESKATLQKNIVKGNKCITLSDGVRLIGKIIRVTKQYVYVNFIEEEYAYLYVKKIKNERFKKNELAFWVREENNFYDINCEVVAPF